jgi:hypothetical protein
MKFALARVIALFSLGLLGVQPAFAQNIDPSTAAIIRESSPVPMGVLVETNGYGVQASLFPQPTTDAWRELADDQQHAYVEWTMSVLQDTYPGLHVYAIDLRGNDAQGGVWMHMVDDEDQGTTTYFP